MGFFKKLFEKKDCEICGGEIGLLGNRKLVDGDMCKKCAAKLSPWFEDRKESTVAQIKEQLAYREANAGELKNSYPPTKTLGEYYKMYIMEENGCPSKFVVSRDADYVEDNADIIRFIDVKSCKVDIEDYKREIKRKNEEGEEVSYNPPRYEFHYDFYIELTVDNPYFNDIRFKVNDDTVTLISELMSRSGGGVRQFLLQSGEFDPSYNPEYRKYLMMCEEISETIQKGQRGAIEQPREIVDPLAEERRKMEFWDAVLAEADLQKKIAMLEEEYARIKDDPSDEAHLKRVTESLKAYRYSADPAAMAAAMTAQMEQKMQNLAEEAKAGAGTPAASAAKVCPACNAEVTGKFCEYCGTKME